MWVVTFFEQVPFCSGFGEMFFFDEIFFPHAFDGVVFLILFVLAEHYFTEGSSAQHLQQLELLEVVDVILVAFALEDYFALGFYLLALFYALCVQHQRLDCMQFFVVFAHVVNGGRVALQGEVVVVVEGHLGLVEPESRERYLQKQSTRVSTILSLRLGEEKR